jgi:hypothetical protein
MQRRRGLNFLAGILALTLLLSVAAHDIFDRHRVVEGGGIDPRLSMSTTLAQSQLVSGPPFWSIGRDLRWVYQPTSPQLAVLRRSCDRRFGGFKVPDCVVSAYVNEAEGSYSVLSVQGSQAIIQKSFMSFTDAKEMNAQRRQLGSTNGS